MGTWIGHFVPGLFFFCVASWWAVQIFRRYFRSLTTKEVFRSTANYSCETRCLRGRSLNIEAIIEVGLCIFGMFLEIFLACVFKHRAIGIGNIQHATMYFFFGIYAVSCLLDKALWFFPDREKVKYFTLFLAYTAEGLLFKFHLFGRDQLDVIVHMLLIYTIAANAVSTLLEMVFREQALLSLLRAYLTVLQGTWFVQVAFILYNPLPGAQEWDSEDHHQLMLVPAIFCWHMGVIFLLFATVGAVIGKMHSREMEFPGKYQDNNNIHYAMVATGDQSKLLTDTNEANDSDV